MLLSTRDARSNRLNALKASLNEAQDLAVVYKEMAPLKMVNRLQAMQSGNSFVTT